MNPGGKRKPSQKECLATTDLCKQSDVIIKRDGKSSLLTQEMRAQGMNLTQNMLRELTRRNLSEIKTTELVKMIIQMFGYFIPKPTGGENDTIIDITNSNVQNIIKQIGMKE